MSVRLNRIRVLLNVMVLAGALIIATAAHAQLGSMNNPPPQHLFNFDGSPKPRNDGLGSMAERRSALARAKARRRPVHRHPK